MVGIKSIKARKIKDSRGKFTVEVELTADSGRFLASVPSGTSTGRFEAKVKEAEVAVRNVNKIIAPKIIGRDPASQKKIDDLLIKLDGTKSKSRLGANAILAISVACLRAGAKAQKLPLWKWVSEVAGTKPKLPYPSLLQVEGGLHGEKGGTDIQEFMTVFQEKSFEKSLKQGVRVYNVLKTILLRKYGRKAVRLGLEGAFIPKIRNAEDVLDLIMAAARKAGLSRKAKIILDVAASHEQIGLTKTDYYLDLVKKYPILGLEDPFAENDLKNWRLIMSKIKKGIMIIGDDLTVTNVGKIRKARNGKLCNAVIIKPNQIGTVSETIDAAKLAKSFGWKIVVSHRSGETLDDFIADLAVGIGADYIKSGAPSKPERLAKYNRLLKIEKELCQN